MIFGIAGKVPSLADMYELNVAAWMASPGVYPLKYEDLKRYAEDPDSAEAELFFTDLLTAAGISRLPENWRDRVRAGADPKQSPTARENLSGIRLSVPEQLSPRHRRLVDFAAPGLRFLLGYETAGGSLA
jgi:hypothetical protein